MKAPQPESPATLSPHTSSSLIREGSCVESAVVAAFDEKHTRRAVLSSMVENVTTPVRRVEGQRRTWVIEPTHSSSSLLEFHSSSKPGEASDSENEDADSRPSSPVCGHRSGLILPAAPTLVTAESAWDRLMQPVGSWAIRARPADDTEASSRAYSDTCSDTERSTCSSRAESGIADTVSDMRQRLRSGESISSSTATVEG